MPPSPSPFHDRLNMVRLMAVWDLLNGRFVRRPPLYRLPREGFVSKHDERRNEMRKWLFKDGSTQLQKRLTERWRKPDQPYYQWGCHAQMRAPARRGMASINRHAGYPAEKDIRWQVQ